MCFSTGSKTGHKSGKWVIWTRLEVEGELNGVVRLALDLVARMWACKAGRRGSGLAVLDREVWASGLVTCFWACKAGLRVGWAVYVWA